MKQKEDEKGKRTVLRSFYTASYNNQNRKWRRDRLILLSYLECRRHHDPALLQMSCMIEGKAVVFSVVVTIESNV
jgi:hypothetical protein